MDEKTIQSMIKEALFKVKEESVLEFAKKDLEFQASQERHHKSERAYGKIRDTLPDEQRQIVEELIEATEENHTDMNDLTYMAGMRDMFLFLESYGMVSASPVNTDS